MGNFNDNIAPLKIPGVSNVEYAIGDILGTQMEVDVAGSGKGGTIRALTVYDQFGVNLAMRIYIFESAPADLPAADNEPFVFDGGDLAKLVDTVDIAASDYKTVDGANCTFAPIRDLNYDFKAPQKKLYLISVALSVGTYPHPTSLSFKLNGWAD